MESGSSSSSSDSEPERKRKRKDERKDKKKDKKKKEKKSSSKKSKKHKKHRSKDEDRSKSSKSSSPPPAQIDPITDADYFSKNVEFRKWLLAHKQTIFTDLNAEQARALFNDFVEAWNKGRLSGSYYKGFSSADLDGVPRTSHKWKMRLDQADRDRLENVKDDIDTFTFRKSGSHHQPPAPSAPAPPMPPPPGPGSSRAPLDAFAREEQAEASQKRARQEAKQWQRRQADVMEELVPRETGRDAALEKRRQITAKLRKDDDDLPEYRDSDLLGSSGQDDFKRMLAREQERKNRRAAEAADKVSTWQEREKERMAQFMQSMGLAGRFTSSGAQSMDPGARNSG